MRRGGLAIPVQITACVLGVLALDPLSSFAQSNNYSQPDLHAPIGIWANIRLTPGPSFVNTTDPAVPGAEEVIVDVPSVFHRARFQRGEINGWRYALYPDGSATVIGADNQRGKPFTMDCRSGLACQIARPDGTGFSVPAAGAPRPTRPENPDGNAVLQYLAEWVLAGTGSPPVEQASPDLLLPLSEPHRTEPEQITGLEASSAQDEAPVLQKPLEEAAPQQESVATEEERSQPEGPAPVCTEPDPFLPSLCLDSSADPAPTPMPRAPSVSDETPSPKTTDSTPLKLKAAVEPQTRPSKETILGRIGLTCSLTGSTSLGFVSEGSSSRSIGKPRLSLGCSSKLTEKLSLRFTLLKYINTGEQTNDDPDFTYAFNYRYSDKLTFNYSNYSAQFGGANGGIWNALNDGTLRGSYKFPSIKLPNQKQVPCSASVRLPNPFNNSMNISCGYAVTDKLRIGGTLNLYMPNKQGDYDPDYTYTASYRVSKDLLISYSNYSNNRWAWNRGKKPGPGLSGGSLSVTYRLNF